MERKLLILWNNGSSFGGSGDGSSSVSPAGEGSGGGTGGDLPSDSGPNNGEPSIPGEGGGNPPVPDPEVGGIPNTEPNLPNSGDNTTIPGATNQSGSVGGNGYGNGEGGTDSGNYVYRALNQKDYERYLQGLGLEAKNPNGNWDLKEHLINGSGKASWSNAPFISTTSDLNVANGFNEAGSGYGVVKIDMNKVSSSSYKGYEIYQRVNGVEGLPYHYSIWQQEISVYQNIPYEAIVGYVK
ncbi:MAG: hypothetical protein MJ172_06635 [Clostridia bacterium]|nr:hypothetical protein [Clostridia bacterium]